MITKKRKSQEEIVVERAELEAIVGLAEAAARVLRELGDDGDARGRARDRQNRR